MSITITNDLAEEFGRADEPVEIRTPDGRLLGTFTPARTPSAPDISEEELQRLEDPTTGRWYTVAEVEAKMRELRCSQ